MMAQVRHLVLNTSDMQSMTTICFDRPLPRQSRGDFSELRKAKGSLPWSLHFMPPPRIPLSSASLGRRRHHDQRYSSTRSGSSSPDSDSDTSDTETDSSDSTYSSSTSSITSQEAAKSSDLSPATKRTFALIIALFLLVAFALLLITATDDRSSASPPASEETAATRTTQIPTKTSPSSTATETDSKPIDTLKPLGVSRAFPEKLRGVNLGSLFILEPVRLSALLRYTKIWKAELDLSQLRSGWQEKLGRLYVPLLP